MHIGVSTSAARFGSWPVMAKMVLPKNRPRDQIWQPYLVLGPNMAAIFSPRGPHIAARFGPRTEYGCQIGFHYARSGPRMLITH